MAQAGLKNLSFKLLKVIAESPWNTKKIFYTSEINIVSYIMPLTVEPVCRLDLKAQDEERGNNPYHTLVFQGEVPISLFFIFNNNAMG